MQARALSSSRNRGDELFRAGLMTRLCGGSSSPPLEEREGERRPLPFSLQTEMLHILATERRWSRDRVPGARNGPPLPSPLLQRRRGRKSERIPRLNRSHPSRYGFQVV